MLFFNVNRQKHNLTTIVNKLLFSLFSLATIILLNACGGGSDGESSNSNLQNELFVINSGHRVVATFSSNLPTSSSSFTANLIYSNRDISSGIAYDFKANEMYVTTGDVFTQNTIDVFNNASTLSGNAIPVRSITPNIPDIRELQDLILDRDNDRLYVLTSRVYDSAIAIFNNISQLNGPQTPNRLITNVGSGNFAIDFVRSILYNTDDSIDGGLIGAYSNIDSMTGSLGNYDKRMINLNATQNISGLAIDPLSDRLYAAESGNGIRIIESASTAGFIFGTIDGFISVSAPLISLPQALYTGNRLAYDATNDRLYAGFGEIAYTINNISTLGQSNISTNALMAIAPKGTVIGGFAFP